MPSEDAGYAVREPSLTTRPLNKAERLLGSLAWVGVLGIWAWVLLRMFRASVKLDSGDFKHFYWAAEAMRAGEDVYASGLGGYIYPPTFAWSLQPLVPLGRVWAERSWGGVNLLLTVTSLYFAFRIVSSRLRDRADWRTLGGVMFLAMLCAIEPMRWEFEEGQTDTIVLFGFCCALFLLDRVPWLAGAALGLALTVKHQAIIALPYLLIRRRWASAMSMLAGAVAIAAVPMVTLGPARTMALLSESYGYMAHLFTGGGRIEGRNLHPVTWELSVSVTSAVARQLETPDGVSMALTLAVSGAIGLVVLGLTWLIYARFGVPLFRRRSVLLDRAADRAPLVLLEWCGLLVAILAFSPQSMNRHSFIMLLVFTLAIYVLIVPRRGVTRWPLAIGLGLYLAARMLPPGEPQFEQALAWWRSVGGASWGLLSMWLGLVWTTLSFVRAAERAEPIEQA